jgi:hypothetical protein
MKKIFFITTAFTAVCFWGCKKNNVAVVQKMTEVKATIVVSPTSTININSTGSNAKMGCSATIVGSMTFIVGTNENNAAVYIEIPLNNLCITSPGTYNFSCQYRKNVADPNTPVFSNNGINPGSITFTAINGHHMEGSFIAVCWCNSSGCVFGVDFVNVSGTFKGDY